MKDGCEAKRVFGRCMHNTQPAPKSSSPRGEIIRAKKTPADASASFVLSYGNQREVSFILAYLASLCQDQAN